MPAFLALLFAASLLLPSAELRAQPASYRCARLTTRDGLSQDFVYCMLRDREGFMWFGTRNGLNRYDGYSFTVYHHEPFDPASISHNLIMALAEDAEGNLWIGTHGGGVNRLDRRRRTFHCFRHDDANPRSLAHDMVNALAVDARGRLWIGTWGGGLCLLDIGRVNRAIRRGETPSQDMRRFRHDARNPQSIASDVVSGLLCDREGRLWLSNGRGVDRFDEASGAWTHYQYPEAPAWLRRGSVMPAVRSNTRTLYSTYHASFLEDSRGDLWFSEFSVWRFDAAGNCFRNVSPAHNAHVCEGPDGSLISGTDLPARLRPDGSFETIAVRGGDAVHPHTTMSALADARGSIWVGTADGILRFDRNREPFHYVPPAGLAGPTVQVRSLLRDSDGAVWAGCVGDAVLRFDPSAVCLRKTSPRPFPRTTASNERTVHTIAEIAPRDFILGVGAGALRCRSDGGQARRINYTLRNAAIGANCRIYHVLRDSRGRIWCCGIAAGGATLFTIDERTWTLDSTGSVQREVRRHGGTGVWIAMEDDRRRLWFGTENGVIRFDPADSSVRRFTHEPRNPSSLGHNEVWAIHQARNGTIWIGTMGGGLDRYDEARNRFLHLTMRSGLADNVVKSVLEDARGRLWIATNRGLSRFDPADGTIRNFAVDVMHEAGALQPHAAIVIAGGAFLFGTANGALLFHPDSVRDLAAPVPLAFTGLTVGGTPAQGDLFDGDTLALPAGGRPVSFEFAALDYRSGGRPEYAYLLEGIDRDWVRLGRRHDCSFAALPPGTHTLRIRGTNGRGVWSARELTVTIVVPPPFYLRWWFIALAIALLLLTLSLLSRWRVRRARRRAEYERRLAESELKALRLQINPHFFFNALSAIQSYLSARDDRQANAFIGKFARLMRAILESSRSSTVTVAEEVASLRDYLDLESMRFEGRFEYAIEVDPAVDTAMRLPSMLIQPFVENAVRHGLQPLPSGGRLTVSLALHGDAIVCRVEDNGIGRERAREADARRGGVHRSLGMRITMERLEILNAARRKPMRMRIDDLRDAAGAPCGTRVEIAIPIE